MEEAINTGAIMSQARDPKDQLPLAPHVFQILLSLLEEDRHGYSLIKDIDRRTKGEMTLGTSTVYATLKRMVAEGLLDQADTPPDAGSEGPPRQYFRITPLGREVARAEALRIRRLHDMVVDSPFSEALGIPARAEEGS